MNEEIEIRFEIKRDDMSINLCYRKENLTLENISEGRWFDSKIISAEAVSLVIRKDYFHLLEEAIGYWVNDSFDEKFPFQMTVSINEFRDDILVDPFREHFLILLFEQVG